MITVKEEGLEEFGDVRYKAKDLIGGNWEEKRCAFIGKVGESPESVYVACFDSIVLLDDPIRTWDGGADVYVKEFVDLEVVVKRRVKE